ncbi:hypothetical protein GCM10027297_16360 [Parahaliea aestuarii]
MRIQEGVNTLSFQIVLPNTKESGGDKVSLNDDAIDIYDKVGEGCAIVKCPVKAEILYNRLPICGNFFVLQINFHLVNLQLMKQLEGVIGTVGVTR